ncbi:MAG: RNA polymerase sigma factor [Tenacibaculum sp.]
MANSTSKITAYLNDKALWKSLKEGNLKAFSVLFKKYYVTLYNYGLKISNNIALTEDSLQDFFVYIYEHKENLSDLNRIAPYLFSSYRRFIIRKINKSQKISMVRDVDASIVDINFTAEEFITRQETTAFRNKNLTNLINQLPKRQKEVIYLKFHCNLTPKEIAETMNINYQSVVNTLHKAIKNLREEKTVNQLLSSWV